MTQPTSLVMTRIGGRDYPMRSESNCLTCQSPNRLFIESELMRGKSYRTISKSLEGLPTGVKGRHPSHESISNHVKQGHVPVAQETQRRIIERRAKEIGRSVELDEDLLADHITVNQMIVQRGVEMAADGTLEIKASDVLAASRFLRQVEQESGTDTDAQVWVEAIMEYMEVAQRFIPPAAWNEYSRALNASPVLKALAERKAQTVAGEVAEAG